MEDKKFQTPEQATAPQAENSPGCCGDGEGGKSPIVLAIIASVLILLGVIYYYGMTEEIEEPITQEEVLKIEAEIASEPDAVAESLQLQSDSDAVVDIEKDLDATMLDGLDKELGNIDKELGL